MAEPGLLRPGILITKRRDRLNSPNNKEPGGLSRLVSLVLRPVPGPVRDVCPKNPPLAEADVQEPDPFDDGRCQQLHGSSTAIHRSYSSSPWIAYPREQRITGRSSPLRYSRVRRNIEHPKRSPPTSSAAGAGSVPGRFSSRDRTIAPVALILSVGPTI
jgi:hypothetical protein